jgi:hypothetical protein
MHTLPTKTVLFAFAPASKVVFRTAIPDNFRCYWCTSLAQVQQTIPKRFDLIVCCTLFDSSQMFELLRYCKASPISSDTPILCVRAIGGAFDDAAFQGIAIACKAFGASDFLDLDQLIAEFGSEYALKAASNILINLCDSEIRSHFYPHSANLL